MKFRIFIESRKNEVPLHRTVDVKGTNTEKAKEKALELMRKSYPMEEGFHVYRVEAISN